MYGEPNERELLLMAQRRAQMFRFSTLGVMLIGLFVAFGMWGCPTYNVWQKRLLGEAELRRAEYNRQILVQEAKAKEEASKSLAQAEINRAEGAAQANHILGSSLKGNEEYLRYLWIQAISHDSQAPTVIYVPTEAGLPILEAGKR